MISEVQIMGSSDRLDGPCRVKLVLIALRTEVR